MTTEDNADYNVTSQGGSTLSQEGSLETPQEPTIMIDKNNLYEYFDNDPTTLDKYAHATTSNTTNMVYLPNQQLLSLILTEEP